MNVYKLKSGKTSGAFQLPLRGILVSREVNGEALLKEIQYIPGASSFYKEDHKGDDKPKPLWFDDGEIRANPDDKILNGLMQIHPWFKDKYVLVNEEETAKEEIGDFERLTKASNAIINEKDDYKLKAMAMILISLDAATWNPFKCKSELLKYAKNHSTTLLASMAKPDYEGRFLAALAFAKGIVKHNEFQTEVLWADGEQGIIVRVAEGEKGVDKLGEFLSKKNDSSSIVLQRIGEKAEALITVNESEVVTAPTKSVEEIQAEAIEAYKSTLVPTKTEAELRAEIQAEMEATYKKGIDPIQDGGDGSKGTDAPVKEDMEALKAEYKEVTGKEVSPRYYNDPEWIKGKIAEAKNT
jgi:hypothetical protein